MKTDGSKQAPYVHEGVLIRPIAPDDSWKELTELLHRAYAEFAEAGMHFVASHQSVKETRERASRGECWVGEFQECLVCTVTIVPPGKYQYHVIPQWYQRADVAVVKRFAVEPAFRGRGIGRALLDLAEQRAREMGATELALDTAEGAERLIAMYKAHGYRFIEYVDWRPATNYRSVILSKTLL